MKNSVFLSIIASLSLATVIGCGSKESPSESSTSSTPSSATSSAEEFKITMIAKSTTNPVFLSARTGAEAAAKELSEKGIPVVIDWRTPDKEDGQEQASRIAQAVSEGADAILIACSDAAKVTSAINDAVDKGVPVMTFDSDAPESKRFAFYGADDMEVGKQVLEELAKQNNGKGNVAILAGNQNAPNLQKRVQGVKEAAKAYPGIKIVDVFYHIETPQDSAAEVKRVMNANPQIDSWAMVGGWPLFTPALSDLDPAKVKIVAVDCLPAQMMYVEKGIAPVLLAQPVFEWGHTSVHKLYEALVEKKSVSGMIKMDLITVTKDSLGSWAKQLKDWGFTDVDPKYLAEAK